MTESAPQREETEKRRHRRRMLNLGEAIAIGALAISALGLWNGWRGKDDGKAGPTTVVEKQVPIPLALRGKVGDDGRSLTISPVEATHALDSMTLTIAGKTVELGSDGRLAASDVEPVLETTKEKRTGTVPVAIAARYVEAGEDRRGGGAYRLSYRWDGGGLFGGRSLKITGFSRS